MQTRWVIGLALASGVVVTTTFAACAGGDKPRMAQPAPSDTAQRSLSASAAPGPSVDASATHPFGGTPPGTQPSGEPSEAQRLEAAIDAARQCESPSSAILNHPDGGVVFNNAMTSADAGGIDRMEGVIAALAERSDAFRCCFDHWLAQNEGGELRVMLQVSLAPSGAVESAAIDPRRSTAGDEVLAGCMSAVASETSFPASPTGVPTLVEYPFVVTPGD